MNGWTGVNGGSRQRSDRSMKPTRSPTDMLASAATPNDPISRAPARAHTRTRAGCGGARQARARQGSQQRMSEGRDPVRLGGLSMQATWMQLRICTLLLLGHTRGEIGKRSPPFPSGFVKWLCHLLTSGTLSRARSIGTATRLNCSRTLACFGRQHMDPKHCTTVSGGPVSTYWI